MTEHLQLYHSSDGGASYQPVASNDPPGSQLTTAIQMNGDFGYVATSDYRVDVTFDGGRTWTVSILLRLMAPRVSRTGRRLRPRGAGSTMAARSEGV